MRDLRNIPLEELSKATNPFHVNVIKFDSNRIIEAYPELIISEMVSRYQQQTNEYIVEELISLNIDKDVLVKQAEEISRLNSEVQELCDKAYEQAIKDSIDVLKEYYNLVANDCNRDFGYSALNDLVCKLEKLIK